MNDIVIRAENLGKKYRIKHQQERQRYVALRDVFADKLLSPWRWFKEQGAKSNGQGSAQHSALSTQHSESALNSQPGEKVDFWALKDISFEVKRGEVIGIIGRNGAGKSTLLKLLSRITEPTEGRVGIRGRIASLLEVGTGFHPELTGRENTFLYGAVLGMSKKEVAQKFDEIVAFAETQKFVDTPVKHYSSGMYMRLAFSVAAHLEPEILLVDEVLAVGDSAFQKKCLGKMKSVTGEGRTVLFVSHNMAAIEFLCSRCLLLNNGKVDSEGATDAVIRTYVGLSNASCLGFVEFDEQTRERFGPKELAIMRSLQLTDHNGETLQTARMGQPVTVLLEIEFKKAGPGFEIGVAIVNTHGVYLHYFISNWEGLDQVDTPGLKTVEVEIPALYLFPGTYYLSVWVKRQGGAYDDAVHEALSFEVEEASLTPYPTYFGRYSHNSQVYAPSHWRFVEKRA